MADVVRIDEWAARANDAADEEANAARDEAPEAAAQTSDDDAAASAEIARLAEQARVRDAALAQSNKHDVKRVQEQFSKLTVALTEKGRMLDYARLRADCEAGAVAQLLVAKGLVSEEEMQVRVYLLANRIVADALQRAEEMALAERQAQQMGPQIVTPGGGKKPGGLIVPGQQH